jgi:hypothetical protein
MNTTPSANELQTRLQEIGLAEELMVALQITDYDLAWSEDSRETRDRFLKQGYILVVDHRATPAETYLIPPHRQQCPVSVSSPARIEAV